MSGWDIAVIIGGGLQLAAVAMVGVAVLRLKGQFVDRTLARVRPFAPHVKQLIASGQRAALALQSRSLHIAHEATALASDLKETKQRGEGLQMPITYATLLGYLGNYRQARSVYRQATGLFRPKPVAAPVGPRRAKTAAVAQRSLADRLGLIPPAAKHLGTARRLLAVALDIRRELRQRGLH